MSVNAAFSMSFRPSAHPLFRTLREDLVKPAAHVHTHAHAQASHHNGALLEDVDSDGDGDGDTENDDDLVSKLMAERDALAHKVEEAVAERDALVHHARDVVAERDEVHAELAEMVELTEAMQWHVEMLEAKQQSMGAYVGKLNSDVRTVKRRSVWQKIEFDKERQQLVEELHDWKRRSEDLKTEQEDALTAAEATAAWEAACLNQTIDKLRQELASAKMELAQAHGELAHRGPTVEEAAETEQVIEALKDLVLALQSQADEATESLAAYKQEADQELAELHEQLADLKQRSLKQDMANDKEHQELAEEVLFWKNRAMDSHWNGVLSPRSEGETTATFGSVKMDDSMESLDTNLLPVHEADENETDDDNEECEQEQEVDLDELPLNELPPVAECASEPEEVEADAADETPDEENNQDDSTHCDTAKERARTSAHSDSIDQVGSASNKSCSEQLADKCDPPLKVRIVDSVPDVVGGGKSDNQQEDGSGDDELDDDGESQHGDSLKDHPASETSEDDGLLDSPTLATPQRQDSFFSRLRSFSFRSRTDSMASIESYKPELAPTPSGQRSRTNSVHSTTSTKSKAPSVPVMATPSSSYFHPDPYMNSLNNFM